MERFRNCIGGWLFFTILAVFGCSRLNSFQKDGELELSGLKAPVKVLRDEKGMAYIYAQNREDAIMAHGFVAAQDRLFQMEFLRRYASGRLSEFVGEDAKALDIRMRTLGFYRNARKHAGLLNAETRLFFQRYLDGVNAYIETRSAEHPIEFKLAGITPQPWQIEDSLALMYFMSWDSSANLETEIIAQMLVDRLGVARAAEIFPLNINPDDGALPGARARIADPLPPAVGLAADKTIRAYLQDDHPLRVGSNNWTTDSRLSAGAKPIVANDTHQYASILPGPWYPVCIVTPEFRAVGVMVPGLPGMVVGRNEHIAVGVTNAYGDTQDLYIETLDPADPSHYLEGRTSLPFEVIAETLKIKDKEAAGGFREEKITIRLTRRGPVVSEVLRGLKTDKIITVRWTPFEAMSASLGIDGLLTAKSVEDVRESLRQVNFIMLNFVFADSQGNIGWHVSGKLPVRSKGDGTLPLAVTDGQDDWTGWVPFDQMPQRYNPENGWVGTCNHMTVARDYPYYYTSHASSSYRYRRLKQLLDAPGVKSAEGHWRFQRDTLNLMAERIAPFMARALLTHPDTRELGEILSGWDYRDDPDSSGPSIFQAVYRQFALSVFEDELGKDLATTMLRNWYFWQERLSKMVADGRGAWFDNVNTPDQIETRDALFHLAALEAAAELRTAIGGDPKKWHWGQVHQMEFVSPIRRQGLGKAVLGGGSHPAAGSGETLYRGLYEFNEPFAVKIPASVRMVADLSDDDKVLAVLPGGISERLFNPHSTDQIEAYMNGDHCYWWFSDRAIQEHCRNTLVLKP